MRNEFYRISNSHIPYLLVLLSVIAVMVLSAYYVENTHNDEYYFCSDIQEYSSIEDINSLINDIDIKISELDLASSNYEIILDQLSKEKKIYEYLTFNFIPYDEIQEYGAIRDFSNNSTAFVLWSNGMISFVCIMISFIFVLFLVNLDYLYKTNINLYFISKPKTNIYFKKYGLFMIMLISLYILSFLITKVFGSVLTSEKYYILLAGEDIGVLETKTLLFYDAISNGINLLFVGSIFFFIATTVREFFASLITIIVFIIIFGFLIPYQYPDNYILFFMQPSLDLYFEFLGSTLVIWSMLVKIAIFMSLGILSIYSFRKQRVNFN